MNLHLCQSVVQTRSSAPQVSSLTGLERWVREGSDQVFAALISRDLGQTSTHRRCSRAQGGTSSGPDYLPSPAAPLPGPQGQRGGRGHWVTTAPAENVTQGWEEWRAWAPCKPRSLPVPQLWPGGAWAPGHGDGQRRSDSGRAQHFFGLTVWDYEVGRGGILRLK